MHPAITNTGTRSSIVKKRRKILEPNIFLLKQQIAF